MTTPTAWHAIIMAGGSGTRFWPSSSRRRPKQLLTVFGDRPMVAMTAERLSGVVAPEGTVVVTGAAWVDAVAETLPEIPRASIIAEPVGRNTAPCIGLATRLIASRCPGEDPVIGVFAADHFIADVPAFRDTLRLAYARAASSDAIVIMGVRPTRPETGYGYVKTSASSGGVATVSRFVEKPDRDMALRYLAEGGYWWNAGLFFFRASVLLSELRRQQPALARGLDDIAARLGTPDQQETIDRHFPMLPKISIDYGVMENAARVELVPCEAGWSDVGHWAALPDVLAPDAAGNVAQGDVLAVDTADCVLINEDDRLLAVVGLRGMVVVQTERATLVVSREDSQRVKEVVDALTATDRDDQL
jgi:mannose-1-phosphate guanylyltransferase